MQLVLIAGPAEAMRRLGEVGGVDFERASATRIDDDVWRVAGYATDEALARLATRGLTTDVVVSAEKLAEERTELFAAIRRAGDGADAASVDLQTSDALPAYPATVGAIDDALAALATAHPSLCTRTVLPEPTHEGRPVSALQIANGGTTPVLLTGGLHAREWVPPDALLSLVKRLLEAYEAGGDLVIPAFTDTASTPPVAYPAASIAAADVRRIVERVRLHVIACVNPDGRAFSQSAPENAFWRKNRRPPPPGSACFGVDVNRNFDIAWDYNRFFSPDGAKVNSASTDPCHPQVYVGPAAASEPEVRNVVSLIHEQQIAYLLDVHAHGRRLLYPWGMDGNQTTDTSQSYRNAEWDGRRDGMTGGPYDEHIPAGALARHIRIGEAMRDAILAAAGDDPRARTRSEHSVIPSLALYPTTGTISDYVCTLRDDGSVISFTLECGHVLDGEGGPFPGPAIYPKIEREVHLAALALLLDAAGG